MIAGDRKPDPVFLPSEKLFRRYLPDHYDGQGFTGMAFSLTEAISVNRGKYSIAEDVIFDENGEYNKFGVVSFRVSNIPQSLPNPEPRHGFVIKHTPYRLIYAHSDILCNNLVDLDTHIRPSRGVRKLLQTELSRSLTLEIPAPVV
jgi:hypothetical protein